jgi:hypothetical protein
VAVLILSITGKPKLIFGTKRPSITSRCNQSASLSLSILHSSPKRRKSEASKEGATIAIAEFVPQDKKYEKCKGLGASNKMQGTRHKDHAVCETKLLKQR